MTMSNIKTSSEKADMILRVLGLPIELKENNKDFFNRRALINMIERWSVLEKLERIRVEEDGQSSAASVKNQPGIAGVPDYTEK